jgi:5'-nucleotidase
MILSAALLLLLASSPRCVEVTALSDLHGRADALPEVGARVAAMRQRGPTVVLDAGDSMQGTIEASLSRGEVVVAGYGALGLDATAVGNHDFDYGPEVLRQRAAVAPYPFLAANVRVRATGVRPKWRNVYPRRLLRPPGGPVVGVFGLASLDTPVTTMPRNVAGLRFVSAEREAEEQAAALRAEGAEIVVGIAHIGGRCGDLGSPDDLSSCDTESELFKLVRRLPPGAVDAMVGGHTHAFVNHRVNGVAVVQAGARAEALAWVTVCAGAPAQFHPFFRVGSGSPRPPPDARVAAAVEPYLTAARAERERPIGVRLAAPLTRSRTALSPFGAATAASLRDALHADFALMNAGGLRVDLPAGEITYGQLFEALPFEDHLVVITLKGSEAEALVGALGGKNKGFPQLAGLVFDGAAVRTCAGERLVPDRTYTLATNEFLASGGDGLRAVVAKIPRERLKVHQELLLRDVFARWLEKTPPQAVSAACP